MSHFSYTCKWSWDVMGPKSKAPRPLHAFWPWPVKAVNQPDSQRLKMSLTPALRWESLSIDWTSAVVSGGWHWW